MSYLLTNGIITKDLKTYLKDIFHLNFKMYPNDIPFNTELGINRRISDVDQTAFSDIFRSNITEFLQRLNARHGLAITLDDLEIYTEEIYVSIKIDEDDIVEYLMPNENN